MLLRNDSIAFDKPNPSSINWGTPMLPQRSRPPSDAIDGPLHRTRRRIALLIDTSGAYGRGLLQGIARYNREHARWSLYARPHGMGEPLPGWLGDWCGDGILARITSPEMAQTLARIGLPTVNLRGGGGEMPFPSVHADNAQIAELAAQHLQDRGLRQFAFCGRPDGENASLDARSACFRRAIERAGYPCHDFAAFGTDEPEGWDEQQERLANWIWALPRPIGIMACNDERGFQVLDACRRCGVTVPDEVAVIGVDNDEALCELSIPPLSSIDPNALSIGYEAAALLEKMMDGRKPPARSLRIAPRGVVARRSTDLAASEDEEVSRAIRYIRENACRGLQVVDVLAYMGMSRASLQQRMKQIMGRTIHREIQRVRMDRVKELLLNADITTKQVARESGFASVQYMTRVFRTVTGETPARYRSRRTK